MAKMLSGFDGGEVSAAYFERVVCPSAPTRAPLPKRRRFRRALAANPPALLCLIAVLTYFYKLDSIRGEMTEELEKRR